MEEHIEQQTADVSAKPSSGAMLIGLGFTIFVILGIVTLFILLGADDKSVAETDQPALNSNEQVPVSVAQRATGTLDAVISTVVSDPNQRATIDALIQSEIDAAIQGTLIALTPTATALPTNVPIADSIAHHNPSKGEADAPITLVEFSDYLCSFCGRFHQQTLEPLLAHYGDLVRFVYREYPVIGRDLSAKIGASAQCANLQGRYWEFTDQVWKNQFGERKEYTDELLVSFAENVDLDMEAYSQCVSDGTGFNLVVVDFQDGQNYQITGTPTFFINGERFVGAQPLEAFQNVIDRQLLELGIEPPARS